MATILGLKLLTADGRSINFNGRGDVRYTGDWQDIPGNGAYVAITAGLVSGGYGPTLAVMECDAESRVTPTDAPPEGVRCYTRVRWMRDWKPATDAQRGAKAAYDKAWTANGKAWDAYGKAGDAYDEGKAAYGKRKAAHDKAWDAYDKTWTAYDKAWAAYLATLNGEQGKGE